MLAKKLRMLAVYSASSALRDSLDMGVLPVGVGRLLVMPWLFRRLVVDEGSTMVVLMLFCYASLFNLCSAEPDLVFWVCTLMVLFARCFCS